MRTERVVVVTGAAGGMGTLFVDRFLGNGDSVVATDIQPVEREESGRLVTVVADLSAEDDCRRVAEVARSRFGRVDVLVNAAGEFPVVPFEEMTAEQWRRIVEVNLTSDFLITRAVLPLMKGRGWGRIVLVGSASVFIGVPGQAHYVAAKAGVVGFARSIARELGSYGITVNVVAPGLTVTPPVEKNLADLLPEEREKGALKRDERPDDLVGAVFFMASPDAAFISGQTLTVDGGRLMS